MKLSLSRGLTLGVGSNSGGAAPAFSPSSLFQASETGGWWEVRSGQVFQDTAGTTPATADGDPVARVNDLSGNANHLLQSTAGARPTLRISGSIWRLEFDGTSDFLLFTDFMADAVGAGDGATAVVSTAVDGSSTSSVLSEGNSGSVVPVFDVIRAGGAANQFGPVFRNDANSIYLNRAGTGNGADNTHRILTADFSGSTSATRVDGVSDLASASFTYGTTTVNQGAFGCFPRTTFISFSPMDLYAAVARGDQMTAQQISDTEAYLATLTGVAI